MAYTFIPWLLDSFHLARYGSKLRKRYTQRLLLIFLEVEWGGGCKFHYLGSANDLQAEGFTWMKLCALDTSLLLSVTDVTVDDLNMLFFSSLKYDDQPFKSRMANITKRRNPRRNDIIFFITIWKLCNMNMGSSSIKDIPRQCSFKGTDRLFVKIIFPTMIKAA